MALALEVGYLADMREHDVEGEAHFRQSLADLNRLLQERGLPLHHEPESCPVFSCSMFGYSGFHYLQRLAAYLDLKGKLPSPGDADSYKDPILQEYYRRARAKPGFWQKLFNIQARPRHFDHLLFHSGCEGFYLPQDFAEVMLLPEGPDEWARMLGSSQRLQTECEKLAQALSLDLSLNPESDEVMGAAGNQGKGKLLWQKYGVESYTCLQMHRAALHSIEYGALLVFC